MQNVLLYTHTGEKHGIEYDDRWVVAYNPYLLLMMNCHINVEATVSIAAIRYVNKYITKGCDMSKGVVVDDDDFKDLPPLVHDDDEVKNEVWDYIQGRCITPPQAVWRILGFPYHESYPSVL